MAWRLYSTILTKPAKYDYKGGFPTNHSNASQRSSLSFFPPMDHTYIEYAWLEVILEKLVATSLIRFKLNGRCEMPHKCGLITSWTPRKPLHNACTAPYSVNRLTRVNSVTRREEKVPRTVSLVWRDKLGTRHKKNCTLSELTFYSSCASLHITFY